MGVRIVAYDVIEQIRSELWHWKVMDEIFDKHMESCVDPTDSADKIGEKLLFTNASMAPTTAFIQRWTCEAVAAERVTTEMKKPLKAQMLDTGRVPLCKSRYHLPVVQILHQALHTQTNNTKLSRQTSPRALFPFYNPS